MQITESSNIFLTSWWVYRQQFQLYLCSWKHFFTIQLSTIINCHRKTIQLFAECQEWQSKSRNCRKDTVCQWINVSFTYQDIVQCEERHLKVKRCVCLFDSRVSVSSPIAFLQTTTLGYLMLVIQASLTFREGISTANLLFATQASAQAVPDESLKSKILLVLSNTLGVRRSQSLLRRKRSKPFSAMNLWQLKKSSV